MDDRGIVDRFSADYSLFQMTQNASGGHTWAKAPVPEENPSPATSAEFWNEWSCTATPSYMSRCRQR